MSVPDLAHMADFKLGLRAYLLALMAIDRRGKPDYEDISRQLDETVTEVNRRPFHVRTDYP